MEDKITKPLLLSIVVSRERASLPTRANTPQNLMRATYLLTHSMKRALVTPKSTPTSLKYG